MKSGTLYIVASPIGNLEDFSPRAQNALREVSLVAAEDTRRTRKLLTHFELNKPLIRCDERLQEGASRKILRELDEGQSVAFLSDAGVPTLSDPGAVLVNAIAEAGHSITPIPGPSAITTALSVAGFPVVPYSFFGFLPRKGKFRREIWEAIEKGRQAIVLFESPFRLQKTLDQLGEAFPDRRACVGRELTKFYEETARGTLSELASHFGQKKIRGECTIVIAHKGAQ